MDLEQVQRLAQAFAQGVAFARGFTEMAQDAKDGEEDGHWVTIGGERGADGEKHGGRPVFISGSGTIKKGLSKSAQGKTLGQVFGKGGEFSSEGKKSKGEADHIRRIQEPEKREEPQEDPLYVARGKMINDPAKTNATREPSVSRKVPRSFDLSTKEIKDLTDKLRDYTDDRIGSYEFGRKLQDMKRLSAEIDKMDKRYSFPMVQQNLEEARHHLGLAAREVRLMDNYQWRGAIPTLRSEITKRMTKANRLYQAAQSEIDAEQKRPW